jgi:hypothetical protein
MTTYWYLCYNIMNYKIRGPVLGCLNCRIKGGLEHGSFRYHAANIMRYYCLNSRKT